MEPRRKKKTRSTKRDMDNDNTIGGEKIIQSNGIYLPIAKERQKWKQFVTTLCPKRE
jgi:hypothetical protein